MKGPLCVDHSAMFDLISLTNLVHSNPVSSIYLLLDVPRNHQIFRLAYGVVGGANSERGAGIRGDQVGVTGGARQAQHKSLLVQTIDSVGLSAVAMTNSILAALARRPAAGRGGHCSQAQEPVLVQVLQKTHSRMLLAKSMDEVCGNMNYGRGYLLVLVQYFIRCGETLTVCSSALPGQSFHPSIHLQAILVTVLWDNSLQYLLNNINVDVFVQYVHLSLIYI